MKNKRGQMTIFWAILIGILLVLALIIGVGGIVFYNINEFLSQDVAIGSVNLKNVTEDTFGKATTMYLNNADFWGLAIIFGMVIGLFFSSYLLRNTLPKWALVLDIFIIIGIFMLSLYVSSTYQAVLDSLQAAGQPFLEEYTPKTSMFILNLPLFSVIIGVICMVLFHSSIPRKTGEAQQSGGLLQGAY